MRLAKDLPSAFSPGIVFPRQTDGRTDRGRDGALILFSLFFSPLRLSEKVRMSVSYLPGGFSPDVIASLLLQQTTAEPQKSTPRWEKYGVTRARWPTLNRPSARQSGK